MQRHLNIAKQIEEKTRKQFPNNSANRLEDGFVQSQFIIAHAEQLTLSEIINKELKGNNDIGGLYQIVSRFSSGPCQVQAVWAFAQYIMADYSPVYYVSLGTKTTQDHQFIVLGDYNNHETSIVHDPHGHEVYPLKELLLKAGRHAHRYGPIMSLIAEKKESWSEAKIREYLHLSPEATLSKFNATEEQINVIAHNEEYYHQSLQLTQKSAATHYKDNKFALALPLYQDSLRLSINLHGESNADTFLILYNLASTYLELKMLDEADWFLSKTAKLIKDKIGPYGLFPPSHLILTLAKILYKMGLIHLEKGEHENAKGAFKACISLSIPSTDEKQLSKFNEVMRLAKEKLLSIDNKAAPNGKSMNVVKP